MKQSTKLLSLVLALVMAFSCMSVIGNAALVKDEVVWDNIDDANLTAEQVADLALDLVDNDLLAGMDTIDLSIIGELRLNKIDYILEDIISLRNGFVWAIGSGLLGDVGDLNFSPLLKSGKFSGVGNNKPVAFQRSHGDLEVIGALLNLLNSNAGIISKAANGIGTDDGLDLGLIGSFLNLGEVGDMLADIPKMLVTLVYDLLIFGSYGYNDSSDDLKEAGQALPTTVDSIDEIVDTALANLLTKPQDYDYEGEGDNAVKVWDEYSYISKSLRKLSDTEVKNLISPRKNSLFQLIDNVAQYAIDDLAINALNNNLKKALMEAVEIDFNELDVEGLPAEIKTAFELTTPEYERSYVNYIGYDCLKKANNGVWYYTTLKTEVQEDPVTGEPLLDADGNEITERERKFYKANFGSANEFAALVNWDWKFVESTSSEAGTKLIYDDIINAEGGDGSLVGAINNLVSIVYDVAIAPTAKAGFKDMTGVDGWIAGSNANFNTNITNFTKYILVNFGDKVFGEGSPYANYKWADLASLDIVDMVALIGPGFFEDAMPQILLPKNADGTYAFTDGVQIYQFGAVVLRELITGIAPNVNYDDVIFKGGSVDAQGENGRQYADHTVDEWFNIILNMGVDLGLTYLDQITNFRDYIGAKYFAIKDADGNLQYNEENEVIYSNEQWDAYLTNVSSADKLKSARWMLNLDEAILWAVQYIGSTGDSAVLAGLDFDSVSAMDGPFEKLSYILNTILPLGFINGLTSESWDVDVTVLVEKIKTFFTTFDLSLVLGLLGRNTDSSFNILGSTNLVTAVLTLVNNLLQLIFPGNDILGGVNTDFSAEQSVDAVISKANLKATIQNLLTQLYDNKDAILLNALPVVGKLIKGWGTEQSFQSPQISLSRSITADNGNLGTQTVTVRNASNGVWRHYVTKAGEEKTDEQYKIQITGVSAHNYDGTPSTYVTATLVTTTEIGYGQSGTFTYTNTSTAIPATGAIVRFDVKYKVFDEFGAQLGGKEFVTRSYSYINYKGSDAGTRTETGGASGTIDPNIKWGTIKAYVDMSGFPASIENAELFYLAKDTTLATTKPTFSITSGSGDGLTGFTVNSITLNSGKRNWAITPYKSQAIWASGDDAGEKGTDAASENEITINSNGFNEASWKALNKRSGDTGTVTANISGTRQHDTWAWKTTDYSGTITTTFRYYDGAAKNLLTNLVLSEMNKMRLEDQYNITGTSYAGEVLVATDSSEDIYADDFELRQTNFAATGYNPEEEIPEDGEATEVTVIDNATAWATYNTAFQAAIRGAFCEFNDQAVYNYQELYNALKVAADDVEYLKKTTEELIEDEVDVDDVDGDIDALAGKLYAAEARTTDHLNYTDYKMYRLNRFNDAREDARYYIQLKEDANSTLSGMSQYFDYNWMENDDLEDLVNAHTYNEYDLEGNPTEKSVAQNKYKTIILALLKDFSDEEIAAKQEWLDAKKVEYASVKLLDVQMATTYLQITEERLLTRNHGILTNHLQDEVDSAENEIGRANNGRYTEGSWANYEDALAEADTVLAAENSQKEIFDAKYNLLVQRKRLVKVDTADMKYEADYTELEALIAQADYALNNMGLYDNTNEEFGQVLAELGMDPIINKWGDEVQLFPGSALLVKDRAYGIDDQDKIDDAATALKEALARLKFKGTTVSGATVTEETLVEADEANGIEAITAPIARIAANQNAAAVKGLFTVTADNATVGVDNITVSNDVHYTIDTDLAGFAGTNSTVTFYTLHNGVKIPVKTIKLVVDGDVNGDGTVDVLDSHYAALVEAGKGELEGCYLLAGDIDGADDRKLTEADYSLIINKAVA